MPKFVSDILAKAGLVVDGVVTLNNTATGQTPASNDNSTKLATTAWVRNFVTPYTLPIASATTLGGVKVGSGLSIDAGTGILSAIGGGSLASFRTEYILTATAGQTTFTISGGYTPERLDVFLNGVYLNDYTYTATDSSTIVLDDAASLNDILTVFVYSPFYVGDAPSSRDLCVFTATSNQTVFTCNYVIGSVDVYYNGSKLASSEFTANNGTSVTLATPCKTGDYVEIISWVAGGGISATSFVATAPLSYDSSTYTFTISQADTDTNGYLSYTDWNTFNNKLSTSRTLTINGVTYDLTSNRSWSALPTGGVAGDILAKVDGTDYNATWIPNYTSQVQHQVKLSTAMTAGTPVYVSGTTGNSGTNMIVSKASNDTEGTSSKTLGLIATGGATNDIVFVVTEGLLADLDTSTANAGDPVWLGTNGGLIFGLLNKPTAPAHLVFIGVVTRAQQNNGEIFVKVQNGFELGELHDYVQNGVQDNYVISYESSTSLYKPKSIATLLGYTPANAARTLTINGTVYDLTADRTWTLTTSDVSEGTNLYYTQSRFNTAFSGKSTTDLTEGTNLYYTQSRFDTAFGAKSTSNLTEGTNLYYTQARFDTAFAAKSTTNLTEGTNLYYTTARVNTDFDTRLATKSTTNLAEGTNLYYTDARVGSYLSTNSYATQSYVSTQINNLISGAPGLLDTLDELAAALGDDANFSTTVSTSLSNRLRIDTASQGLTSTQQGYGRTNLGLGSLATLSSIGNSYITDLAWSKLTGTPTSISGYGITDSLVYTTSTYSNPSWITALAWSKITGAPAFITSYTETDTLATVTGRGATTSTAVTFSGGASISNLLINGAPSISESSLALGAMGVDEGGQLTLNKATSWTYAAHIDVWHDNLRFLYGTNTATSGVAMAVNLSTRQLILSSYTASNSFTGTASGVLAFDSSGNIITIAVPGGSVSSVNAGTGVSVNSTTGAITVSIGQSVATNATPSFDKVFLTNNGSGTNLKVGDDVWIGDVNQTNTLGVVGQQDSTSGYISFGSDYATKLGRTGTGALTWGGNNIYHAGNLTNLNQLTNGPGYITSYSETDPTVSASAKKIVDSAWAGTSGYPGYSYTGGNSRFGFSSSSGVIDVYTDGNFYATDSGYLVLHTNNISSYAITSLTDTLGTVTSRGASTSTAVALSGGLAVNTSKVGFRNSGLTEFIQGEAWTMGIYGYNNNDGFTFFQRDASDVAHPCFHIAGWNNAGYAGWSNADSMITLVRGDGTKSEGSIYAGRGLSDSSYYTNIVKTTDRTVFRDSQSLHQFTANVVLGSQQGWDNPGGWNKNILLDGTHHARFRIKASNHTYGNIETYLWADSSVTPSAGIYSNTQFKFNNTVTVGDAGSGSYGLAILRGKLCFSSSYESNHTIYNNYNNIDGEGSFDGIKMNVYAGLLVRTGNASGTVPTTALDVNGSRTIVAAGELWCGSSNSRNGAVGLVLNDGALLVRAYNDYYHKIWYYDGIAFGTNYAHGHFRFYAESSTQRNNSTGGATLVFDINTVNYTATCAGDITAYSDIRVKKDIEVIPNAIEKVQALRGVTFTRTDHKDEERRHAGVIAQEVQEVLPEVITESQDTGLLTVAYGNMAGLFIEAIKELKAENDELKEILKRNNII